MLASEAPIKDEGMTRPHGHDADAGLRCGPGRARAIALVILALAGAPEPAALAQGKPSARPDKADEDTAPPARPKPALATADADAIRLARSLEAGVFARRTREFTAAFDAASFLKLVLRGLDKLDEPMRAGIIESVGQGEFFIQTIVDQLDKDGTWRFLRLRERGGRPSLLFRLVGPLDSLAYHELVLERRESGLVIADIYDLSRGELASGTLRRLTLMLAADRRRSDWARLVEGEGVLVRSLPTLRKVLKANERKRWSEAFKAWTALPAELRTGHRAISLLGLRAASQLEAKPFLKLVEAHGASFPQDLGLHILMLEYFLRVNNPSGLLQASAALDKGLGGDPYLAIFHARAAVGAGVPDKGLKVLDTAIAVEPSLENLYWERVRLGLVTGRFKVVAESLELIESRLKIRVGDLRGREPYRAFLASPEGQAWQRRKSGS